MFFSTTKLIVSKLGPFLCFPIIQHRLSYKRVGYTYIYIYKPMASIFFLLEFINKHKQNGPTIFYCPNLRPHKNEYNLKSNLLKIFIWFLNIVIVERQYLNITIFVGPYLLDMAY
jgi:hypothetical protein